MKSSLMDSKILEFSTIDLEDSEANDGHEYLLDDFTLNWHKIRKDFFQDIGNLNRKKFNAF